MADPLYLVDPSAIFVPSPQRTSISPLSAYFSAPRVPPSPFIDGGSPTAAPSAQRLLPASLSPLRAFQNEGPDVVLHPPSAGASQIQDPPPSPAPPLNRDSGVSKLGTPIASTAPPHIVAPPPVEVPPSSVFALGEPHLPAFSEVVVLGGGHLWSWTSAADLPFLWLSIPAAVMLKDAWPPPAAAPVAGSPLPLLPQFSGGSSFGFYAPLLLSILLLSCCCGSAAAFHSCCCAHFQLLFWPFAAAALPLRAFKFVGPPCGHFCWFFLLLSCRFLASCCQDLLPI